MKIDFSNQPVSIIQTSEIDEGGLTDFSLSPGSPALEKSINEIGVTHPVVLYKLDGKNSFTVICGHRRVAAARNLNMDKIPAVVLEKSPNPALCLQMNLTDNLAHRRYSDIEKGLIIVKLTEAGMAEEAIINDCLPLLELERSKKLLVDFWKTRRFSACLNKLLNEMNIPLRIFSVLSGWEDNDRNAVEKILSALQPGINKWREFLELTDETAVRDSLSPCEILSREEVRSIMNNDRMPSHEKYDAVLQLLNEWRYPTLSDLRKKFLLALDKLDLDRRTKVRVAKYFENDEIKIELRFTRQEELLKQVEKLAGSAGSDAMKELIRIVKGEAPP